MDWAELVIGRVLFKVEKGQRKATTVSSSSYFKNTKRRFASEEPPASPLANTLVDRQGYNVCEARNFLRVKRSPK